MAKDEKEKDEIVEEEEKKDENTDPNGEDDEKDDEPSEKTFTQDEVSRMAAKEKRQGIASVYKLLGIKSTDKEGIKAVQEFIKSRQNASDNESESKVNEANRRALIAETKAEAMQVGVQAQFVDDVVTLTLAKLDNEDGLDVKTALGELKTKYPVWFEGSKDDKDDKGKDKKDEKEAKKKTGQRGTGSSIKSSTKDSNDKDEKNLGARLAAKRTNSGKKSYWSI